MGLSRLRIAKSKPEKSRMTLCICRPSKKAATTLRKRVKKLVASDSGTSVVCQNEGIVEAVDASRVVVRRLAKGGELGANVDIYNLVKYQRTNQNTCFNQKPIVNVGDRVKKSDVIGDGP